MIAAAIARMKVVVGTAVEEVWISVDDTVAGVAIDVVTTAVGVDEGDGVVEESVTDDAINAVEITLEAVEITLQAVEIDEEDAVRRETVVSVL